MMLNNRMLLDGCATLDGPGPIVIPSLYTRRDVFSLLLYEFDRLGKFFVFSSESIFSVRPTKFTSVEQVIYTRLLTSLVGR